MSAPAMRSSTIEAPETGLLQRQSGRESRPATAARGIELNASPATVSDGVLQTFPSRIKLAKALDWIDADMEADLNVIRDIRNRLAHSFDHDLSFSDSQIAGRCASLRTTNAYLAAFDRAKDRLHRKFSLEIIAAWRAISEPPRSWWRRN